MSYLFNRELSIITSFAEGLLTDSPLLVMADILSSNWIRAMEKLREQTSSACCRSVNSPLRPDEEYSRITLDFIIMS